MASGLRRAALGAVSLLLASCASPLPQTTQLRLTPAQAVINAAEMPGGVSGVFEMVVRSTGREGGKLFLNSELDYRDPRNLTIDISPAVEKALQERLGAPVENAVARRAVAVRGTARKVRTNFTIEGRPSGKYYFQTHLTLGSARDLTVAGERPTA
jgi:hypothetical protein